MIKKFLPFLLIVTVSMSACAGNASEISSGASIAPPTGQVYAIQLRSTLDGMQRAARGSSGAMIFNRGSLYTFVWNLKDGWGFATINTASKTAVQDFTNVAREGCFVCAKDMRDIANTMMKNNWRVVDPHTLPPAVITALETTGSWLTGLAGSMTSFLVVPAEALLTPPMLQEYAGIDL